VDPGVPADPIHADSTVPNGYARTPSGEQAFRAAAHSLLVSDGWRDDDGTPHLRADLVLEGGGVKGIGLVGAILALSEAGFSFPRVAGTSAGAVVGAFVAAIGDAGKPMHLLRHYLDALHVDQFAPMGPVQRWLEQSGTFGRVVADVSVLARRPGLHSSEHLVQWIRPILRDDFGISTFADLRIEPADDPEMSLAAHRRYRLVVHTSDVTRGQLVRLPWDYHYYGLERDDEDVASAVRASMSIPLYYDPVTVVSRPTRIAIPRSDGSQFEQDYAGGSVTWVDGALLQNFPIHAFDREDAKPPRWPTIGVRLTREMQSYPSTTACHSALEVAVRCVHTATNEWDRYDVDQATAARTIFVDNAGLSATQFDVTAEQREALFLNGVRAATQFVLDAARAGHVPRRSATE
jgi:NTE family protein